MKLLQELLLITEYLLLEDLGSLKAVDRELLTAIFGPKAGWGENKNKTPKLRDALGRDSKIEPTDDKDQNKAFDRLKDMKTKNVVAIILKYDGDQIMMVSSNAKSTLSNVGYKDKPSYTLVVNNKFFKHVPEAEYNAAFTKTTYHKGQSHTEIDFDFIPSRVLTGTSSEIESKIKKAMKIVYDLAKKNKVKLETLAITVDQERIKRNNERATSRFKAIPLPTGNRIAIGGGKYSTYAELASTHFKKLRSELINRLEKYKAGKSKSFDKPDEMMQAMIEGGYLEKVKLMGYTYQMNGNRLNLDELLKRRRTYQRDDNYIEYKLQTNTPEVEALEAQLQKIRDEINVERSKASSKEEGEAIGERYYEKRKELRPPNEFKIIMGLEGGKIVPVAVKIGREDSWMIG